MSSPIPDSPDVTLQLEHLEKRLNRVTRFFGWAATLAICFMIWGGRFLFVCKSNWDEGNFTIEANAFHLRGARGVPRASLALQNDQPQFLLRDANDETRAILGVESNLVLLNLFDGKGKNRAGAFVTNEGISGFAIRDRNGKSRITMTENGERAALVIGDDREKTRLALGLVYDHHLPYIGVMSPDAKAQGVLGMTDDGPLLQMTNENGKIMLALGMSKKDGPFVQLKDENGKERAKLSLSKDGSKIVLQDEDGKAIYSKP